MTPRTFLGWCQGTLKSHFEAREITTLSKILLAHRLGFTSTDYILSMDIQLEESLIQKLQSDVLRLSAHEPIQYILGETAFYGLSFLCKPVALIPRPETEELVHWILSDNSNVPIRILDIGTGSGCIAVALKKNRPLWEVSATDISQTALNLAMENAHKNKADCVFILHDVLNDAMALPMEEPVDIFVSNPPYIPFVEQANMQPNVTLHEPHLALFVPDNDPLVFYRKIVGLLDQYGAPTAQLYCEIHESLADQVRCLFKERGFANTEIRKDLQGKARMIKAQRLSLSDES